MRLLFVFFLTLFLVRSFAAEPDSETPFVVINLKTGRLLMQHAAHKKMYPASTTKVALLAYVLSTSGLDAEQKLVVPQEALRTLPDAEKSRDNFGKYPSYILETSGTIAGFKPGEIITLKDALWGMMLPSGNDAANTLAYYWGNGSIEAGVEQMNRFIESLGCQETHFTNPHGLPHPNHVSSAFDLALIARYAMQYPLFRQIVSSKTYTKERTNKQPAVTFQQHNKLLLSGPYYYEKATGIKTGQHSRAQSCMIASGESQDRSILVVLLHVPDRKQLFLTAKKLLEKFLEEPKLQRTVVQKGVLQLKREVEGQPLPLCLESSEPCVMSYYASEEPVVKALVEWKELRFPVEPGQEVGLLRVFADDELLAAIPLLSTEHRSVTWRQRLLMSQRYVKEHSTAALTLLVLGLLGILFLSLKGRLVGRTR